MKLFTNLLFALIFLSCNNDEFSINKSEKETASQNNSTIQQDSILIEPKIRELTPVTIANTDVKELTSVFNNQTYQLKISFPKSYFENPDKRFPVLYVLDAETNFGGVSYIVQRLIKDELIPEILVVGIAYNTDYKNFYRLRSRDLTPVEDKQLRMGNNTVDPTGGAPQFSDFLEYELFPFITENYRVKEDRAIYGHSYGGLYGSYTLLDKPHLFNRYIILGPSLWFKEKYIINKVSNRTPELHTKTKLYMASGELDLRINDYQEEFVEILNEKNIPNLIIQSEIMENETHRTIFGPGFTNGLRFIYGE